jgi:3',5'-cyclic AMP phosphodiesterase CpdA
MAVPGCEGGSNDGSLTDYCIEPPTVDTPNPGQDEGNSPASTPSSSSSSSSCSFSVALLADPQIGWNRDGYNSEKLFRVAASHLRELKPKFILVAGDMIQDPGNNAQYRTAKSILDSVNIPYYAIAGNHDVRGNPRLNLLNDFVQDWNLPYYWYTVRHCNTLFVMLDSNILRARDDGDAEEEIVELAVEQLEWLDKTLKDATRDNDIDHIIPIAHHPLATRSLGEASKNTNTPRGVRQDLMDIYEAHAGPKLEYVFAGHFHDSARIRHGSSGIDYVTYPSTGVILGSSPREPSGFAILRIRKGSGNKSTLREDYYGYDDMPKNV